jgi:glycosyltransferase involved in cell wall biosynthesis
MILFSVIIPVFNRPEELNELLSSLTQQTANTFEVLVIEDGSTRKSEFIVSQFSDRLDIRYFFKENTGQGFSRNYGAQKAIGKYLIFFDSDVIVPNQYFEIIEKTLQSNKIQAFGGPDAASDDFSDFQKAVSYAMTSIFTTGGIRNQNQSLGGDFHLRSFNMGIEKSLFDKIGGFKKTNMGEDMEINHRLAQLKTKKILIPEAYVFHKRRGNLQDFYNQIFSFGRTRIQLKRMFDIPIKIVHLLPVIFTLFVYCIPFFLLISINLGILALFVLLGYFILIFIGSTIFNKSISVGFWSVPAAFVQLFAYGSGFLKELTTGSNKT